VACLGDFLVTFLLAMLYPAYDSLQQPESFLSSSNSPVAHWMGAWCVVFSALFLAFALGIALAFGHTYRGATLLAWLVACYGIGEGIISGVFPYDFVNGQLTVAGQIHTVGGRIGQGALYFAPLVAWYALHRDYPVLKVLSLLVFVLGSMLLLLYGAAKLQLIGYRGLWQRLFMALYFLYLMYLAWLLYRQAEKQKQV